MAHRHRVFRLALAGGVVELGAVWASDKPPEQKLSSLQARLRGMGNRVVAVEGFVSINIKGLANMNIKDFAKYSGSCEDKHSIACRQKNIQGLANINIDGSADVNIYKHCVPGTGKRLKPSSQDRSETILIVQQATSAADEKTPTSLEGLFPHRSQ